jgi:hypothetical protein
VDPPDAVDMLIALSCGSADDVMAALSALPQSTGGGTYEPDPATWEEAQSSPHGAEWCLSFQEELSLLQQMGVYELVPHSSVLASCHVHCGKPVFHVKCDANGQVYWQKTHLVFCGFEQVPGHDFDKTTSPTAKMESWHILLHLAAHLGWDAQQIDIKTAFLYG